MGEKPATNTKGGANLVRAANVVVHYPYDSRLELEAGEGEDDGGVFCVNTFMGERDPEMQDEFAYYSDVSPSREEESETREEERWWTPDL